MGDAEAKNPLHRQASRHSTHSQTEDGQDGKERKLYRRGSLGSELHGGDTNGVPLETVATDPELPRDRQKRASAASRGTMRTRASSGKSIRSRTASRAEYHQDLKVEIEQGPTKNLLFGCFLIMFGSSYIFGYNIGVLNQPEGLIKSFYNETYAKRYNSVPDETTMTLLWSLTTAMFLPGGMIGSFTAGFLADKIGRKKSILISHFFAFLGGIIGCLCVKASSPELLIAGRFIIGINCGLASQLAPMYLSEISPVNLRGAIGTGHQLFVTIGILVGAIFGIKELLGTPDLWAFLMLLNIVPAFVSLVLLPFVHDSPRYLMMVQKDRIAAEKALRFFRQKLDVVADIEEMETEMSETEKTEEVYTLKKLLSKKELRWPLIIAVVLQVAQQFSGINAIFFYSGSIYKEAGVSDNLIPYTVVGTNAVNVFMTIIAVPVMDKLGRRFLLLWPMLVMIVDMAVITISLNLQAATPGLSYLSIICIIVYVICFAVGLGPIPWMISAELFRQGPRPLAMSIACLVNWICTFIVAMVFPGMQGALGNYTFLVFFVMMIIFTLFVWRKVPETRGKTFEEVATLFHPGDEIEVEEIVDDLDVFIQETPADGSGKETTPMLGKQKNNQIDDNSGKMKPYLPQDEDDLPTA